jgi:hypothetical protein
MHTCTCNIIRSYEHVVKEKTHCCQQQSRHTLTFAIKPKTRKQQFLYGFESVSPSRSSVTEQVNKTTMQPLQ